MATAIRESRRFWAITEEHRVVYATGYICENMPGSWFVPDCGGSLTEDYHLFSTRAEAAAAAILKLDQQIARLQARRAALQAAGTAHSEETP